jgi:hypothetical protein
MNAASSSPLVLDCTVALSSAEVGHWLLKVLRPDSEHSNDAVVDAVGAVLEDCSLNQAQQIEQAAKNVWADHREFPYALGQIEGAAHATVRALRD